MCVLPMKLLKEYLNPLGILAYEDKEIAKETQKLGQP